MRKSVKLVGGDERQRGKVAARLRSEGCVVAEGGGLGVEVWLTGDKSSVPAGAIAFDTSGSRAAFDHRLGALANRLFFMGLTS